MTTYLNQIDDGEVLSFAELKHQRDELLAAARLAHEHMGAPSLLRLTFEEQLAIRDALTLAIARAEGRP